MATRMMTLKDLGTQAKRTAARGEGLVSRARKEAKVLLTDARRLRRDAQRRAEKAVTDLEHRAERMLRTVETRAAKATEPVLGKSFASHREIRELARRVADLEKRVREMAKKYAAAA